MATRNLTITSVAIVLLLALVLFWRADLAMRLEPPQAAFWDIVFKAVGGVVAIGGIAIGLKKYLDEMAKESQASMIEAKKPFNTKRQEVYFDLVSATSTIGNPDVDDPTRREAVTTFWQLYWGAVQMVADAEVSAAIDRFAQLLDETPLDGIQLRNASMDLARASRKSLGFSDQEMADLTARERKAGAINTTMDRR